MKYVVVVRRKLRDTTAAKLSPVSKPLGSIGHRAFLNLQNSQEFLAIDRWDNLDGLQKFMSDPNTLRSPPNNFLTASEAVRLRAFTPASE